MLAAETIETEFGIQPRRFSLLAAHSFNTMFRADRVDAAPLAVRVGEVRIHADGVEEVEAAWLDAIRNETDLHVPTLAPTETAATSLPATTRWSRARDIAR